jgi:CMP-N-acetylneuraminic acid synthetase
MVTNNEKIIAIIPARGGSKRIPHKNIIDFNGKPLIAWTIEAAQKSCLFDTIFVSTDCPEIAAIAQSYGADVPFLRDQFIDDLSPISKATIYTLEQIEQRENKTYATVFQLMPNCPLRSAIDIIDAYKSFKQFSAQFQISCFKFGWMNPWWAFTRDKNFHGNFIFPDAVKQRSQDLDDLYCPTGAIWIANTQELKKNGSFYSEKTVFCPLDWKSALDIDTYEDLEFCNAVFHMLNQQNNAPAKHNPTLQSVLK